MPKIEVRADEVEINHWKGQAEVAGVTLSAWVRESLNARAAAPPVSKPPRKQAPQPAKPSKLDFSHCAHPNYGCADKGEPLCGPCKEANGVS